MKLTIIGCGDAFGSGGRLQACFHVDTGRQRFLIDCGATALIGLARAGLPTERIETILVSHLHGDHFSGLVWWMLHAEFIDKRLRPLTIAGPPGIAERYVRTTEALFPGSSGGKRSFQLRFIDLVAEETREVNGIAVTPYEVSHPSGAPSYALRIGAGGKVISYSGDTRWVDALETCAADADIHISECSTYEKDVPYHLSWRTIEARLDRIGAKRVMLTHMGEEMLSIAGSIARPDVIIAEDGLAIEI